MNFSDDDARSSRQGPRTPAMRTADIPFVPTSPLASRSSFAGSGTRARPSFFQPVGDDDMTELATSSGPRPEPLSSRSCELLSSSPSLSLKHMASVASDSGPELDAMGAAPPKEVWGAEESGYANSSGARAVGLGDDDETVVRGGSGGRLGGLERGFGSLSSDDASRSASASDALVEQLVAGFRLPEPVEAPHVTAEGPSATSPHGALVARSAARAHADADAIGVGTDPTLRQAPPPVMPSTALPWTGLPSAGAHGFAEPRVETPAVPGHFFGPRGAAPLGAPPAAEPHVNLLASTRVGPDAFGPRRKPKGWMVVAAVAGLGVGVGVALGGAGLVNREKAASRAEAAAPPVTSAELGRGPGAVGVPPGSSGALRDAAEKAATADVARGVSRESSARPVAAGGTGDVRDGAQSITIRDTALPAMPAAARAGRSSEPTGSPTSGATDAKRAVRATVERSGNDAHRAERPARSTTPRAAAKPEEASMGLDEEQRRALKALQESQLETSF